MNPAQSLGSTTAYNLALGGGIIVSNYQFRGKWEKFNIIFFFFFHPRESTTPVYICLVGRQGQIPIELDGSVTHTIRGCVNLCMSFDLGLGSIYLLLVICFCFFSCIAGMNVVLVPWSGGQGQNHDNDEDLFTSQRGGLIFAFIVLYS